MSWLEITVNTQAQRIDEVAAKLTAAGFADLVLEDQQELEAFLEENRAYWDYIDERLQTQLQGLSRIKLYLEDTQTRELAQLQTLVRELTGEDPAVAPMAEVDWSESWKDNYPPQPVGRSLLVLPCWLTLPEGEARLPVILDPGLTFGTGAHPSTQMVMEAMEDRCLENARCLDLGSGSGILSIAALRLGAATAVGVDIDPKAEDIARQNAAYNGYGQPEFTALTGNVTADRPLMERLAREPYELVLVNIVADVIIGLAPVLHRFMTENTLLICSGILDTRLEDVVQALDKGGLAVEQIRQKEEWRCLCARRRTQ